MQLSHPTGGHLRRRSLRAAGGLRGAGAGSPPTAEAAMTMPDTITRLGLWPHQANAVSFVHNLWNRGRKGALLSMAMGMRRRRRRDYYRQPRWQRQADHDPGTVPEISWRQLGILGRWTCGLGGE